MAQHVTADELGRMLAISTVEYHVNEQVAMIAYQHRYGTSKRFFTNAQGLTAVGFANRKDHGFWQTLRDILPDQIFGQISDVNFYNAEVRRRIILKITFRNGVIVAVDKDILQRDDILARLALAAGAAYRTKTLPVIELT